MFVVLSVCKTEQGGQYRIYPLELVNKFRMLFSYYFPSTLSTDYIHLSYVFYVLKHYLRSCHLNLNFNIFIHVVTKKNIVGFKCINVELRYLKQSNKQHCYVKVH